MEVSCRGPLFVGIDIGGTNCRVALVDDSGHVLHRRKEALRDLSFDACLEQIGGLVTAVLQDQAKSCDDIVAIGVGCPGLCYAGKVSAAANLPGWRDVPLAQELQQRCGDRPTFLVNDADAALEAEVWTGDESIRDVEDIVLLTLGTGVGTGILSGGRLLQGSRGCIEGGHVIVHPGGRRCGCGQNGCVEAYASGRALGERYMEKMASTAQPTEKVSGEMVVKRARAGDEGALETLSEAVEALALLCIALARILDPQAFVLVGGVASAGDMLLEPLATRFRELGWTILRDDQRFLVGRMAQDCGVIGAAGAARRMIRSALPASAAKAVPGADEARRSPSFDAASTRPSDSGDAAAGTDASHTS